MIDPFSRDALWAAIHSERAALADDLQLLDDLAWATPPSVRGGPLRTSWPT